MEYLVTMTTHVPDGTPDQAVDDIRAREAARSRELAAAGHLLRLWLSRKGGRPIAPGFGKNAVVTGRDTTRVAPEDDRAGGHNHVALAAVPRLNS